jgi:hypothetical protein
MAKTKKYVVREGYFYGGKPAGETVELDPDIGDSAHQLEAVAKRQAAPVKVEAPATGGDGQVPDTDLAGDADQPALPGTE